MNEYLLCLRPHDEIHIINIINVKLLNIRIEFVELLKFQHTYDT